MPGPAPESGGPFIDANKLDFKKYSQRPHLAKVLADFIIYHGQGSLLKASVSECTDAAGERENPYGRRKDSGQGFCSGGGHPPLPPGPRRDW